MCSCVLIALLNLAIVPFSQKPDIQSFAQIIGPKVVFFEPGERERDSLALIEGLELADELDDFDYYTGKASVYLNGLKIPVVYVTNPVILVRIGEHTVRRFERNAIPEPVGMILTDGVQEPRLVPGIGTDEELIAEIKRFFHLK